jgi:hypothetical protein
LLTTTVEPRRISDVVRDRRTLQALGGVIFDYAAERATVYDARRKLVQTMTYRAGDGFGCAAAAPATLSYADAAGPLPFARGTLTPLNLRKTIGGVPAAAWLYQLGSTEYGSGIRGEPERPAEGRGHAAEPAASRRRRRGRQGGPARGAV